MLNHTVHEIGTPRKIAALKEFEAVDHMILEDVELLLREPPLLLEQILFDELLADVEEEPRKHEVLSVDAVQPHPLRHEAAEDREMDAVMEVVVPILIHAVDHGNRRRAFLVEIAQTAVRHDRLQDIHVELAGERSLLKEFFHLAIYVAIVLSIFFIQLYIPFRSYISFRAPRLFRGLRGLLPLYGSEDTVLINVDGRDLLLLEQVDRLTVQNRTALDKDDIGLPVVNRTPDEHLRQQTPNSKRF